MTDRTPPNANGSIGTIDIRDEMEQSFVDYAMSVIVSRALPDVRDGLKPVQRRIIYSMFENNIGPTTPHRKCAKVVGEVMGNYHPHGDTAIYDALVRMAQDFSLRDLLIDPQGNFGTIDDPPGASRYTEARLTHLSMRLLEGIRENTVDFVENYSGETEEPTVLPARFPEPAGQRQPGNRSRNGHQHPLPQPGGGDRRRPSRPREPRCRLRRTDAFRQGPRLPDRWLPGRNRRASRGPGVGPGIGEDAGRRRCRRGPQGPDRHRRHRDALSGVDRAGDGEDPDPRRRQEAFRHRRPSQ